MAVQPPFAPYRGKEPYIFISYAHKDAEQVFGLIRCLHEKKYRIWYDLGIEAGTNWPQTVAEKLLHAELVLIFLSKNALASQNCCREINYAVSQRKEMAAVLLDDAPIPPDMGMQLSVVPKRPYTGPEATAEALGRELDPSLLGDGVTGYETVRPPAARRFNPWIGVSLGLLVLLAGLTAYVFLGRRSALPSVGIRQETVETMALGEVTVTDFSDPLSMEILLGSLRSEAVFLCGSKIVSDARAIAREGDGWTVLGEPVERGSVQKLSYFADKGITQLVLINESLRSLDSLEGLAGLTYLDLSDNPIGDLSPLTALTALQTLQIRCLPEDTELSPLLALPALEQVVVSLDMAPRTGALVEAGIDVVIRK